MMQLLRENATPGDERTPRCASWAGHIYILQRCHSRCCHMYGVRDVGAIENRIDVLAWCRDNDVPWDTVTFAHVSDA